MALIEMDEAWEDWDRDEQVRLEEMFPVIEKPMVKAQIQLGYRIVKEEGTPQIEWELTIVDDDKYTGKTLTYRTPTVGRGKFITKAFLEAAKAPRVGKSIDPDSVVGKLIMLHLSVGATDQGRKFTNIDSVTSV